MRSRRRTPTSAGALLALLLGGLIVSCVGWARAGSHPAAASTGAAANPMRGSAFTYSFVYTDATSVQLLTWAGNGSGSLTGSASELEDLSPGNPNFISSTLTWTGTQVGDQLTITIPGDEVSATLQGSTLLRREIDTQTGAVVTELWVAGTRRDYETLFTAFRAYTVLGQDLQGLTFALETARQFPGPSLPTQIRRYLDDAESQLATLRALRLPHLPGLRIPWIIPSSRITGTLSAAELFLAAGTPPSAAAKSSPYCSGWARSSASFASSSRPSAWSARA